MVAEFTSRTLPQSGASENENLLPRRLVAGLRPEVRAVPAPPLPAMDEPFGLRTVDPDADAALVSEWMNREMMVRAWEYPWPPEQWRRYLRAQLDSDFSLPTMLSYDGTTTGYIEIYRASRDSISTRYDAHPWDLGIHVAIAERAVMPASGMIWFRSIVTGLFAVEQQCRRVMFDPDHRNVPARRLCLHAGCQALGEHQMSNRRMALYSWPRDPDQPPPAYAGEDTSRKG